MIIDNLRVVKEPLLPLYLKKIILCIMIFFRRKMHQSVAAFYALYRARQMQPAHDKAVMTCRIRKRGGTAKQAQGLACQYQRGHK
jgi:hypothetical protein